VPHPELLVLALLDLNLPPIGVALVLALLVLSLGIHEAAHGWVALKCGDTTARDLGRITLNPVPHIDPIMTIALPLLFLYSTHGQMMFGGAKPVPVNYYNLRNPLRDMALVALAGPLSNFLLAAFFFLCLKLTVEEFHIWTNEMVGTKVLWGAVEFNLLLAAFNLLPIPPLDGSRVMTWLLPSGVREPYQSLERWGLLLVVAVVNLVPGVSGLVWTTMDAMLHGIQAIVTLGGTW
jgi:Zn-dependent protease